MFEENTCKRIRCCQKTLLCRSANQRALTCKDMEDCMECKDLEDRMKYSFCKKFQLYNSNQDCICNNVIDYVYLSEMSGSFEFLVSKNHKIFPSTVYEKPSSFPSNVSSRSTTPHSFIVLFPSNLNNASSWCVIRYMLDIMNYGDFVYFI